MSDEEEQPKRPRRKRARPPDAADAGPVAAAEPRAARAVVDAAARTPEPTHAGEAQAEGVYRPLIVAALAAALGLAIVGTSANAAGPWILAAGVLGLIASIHRLGRLGPA